MESNGSTLVAIGKHLHYHSTNTKIKPSLVIGLSYINIPYIFITTRFVFLNESNVYSRHNWMNTDAAIL